MKKIYCISLLKVEKFLVSKNHLLKSPLFSHAIRQIVDLAFDTFEKRKFIIPAVPQHFSIDALPQSFEDNLKDFLRSCLLTDNSIAIEISYSNKKTIVFLK